MSMCCIITITLIQCVFNSYDVLHSQQLLCVKSQNPLKSQDGGKKTALVQKRVSFVAVNISRDA